MPTKQRERLWKNFKSKIHGALLGVTNPLEKIKVKEDLLNSQARNWSPQERKYLRYEIQKEKQSVERALKASAKRSPTYTKNWLGNLSSNEKALNLRETMADMQNSQRILTFNEHTLGRPGEGRPGGFNVASPLKDLFRQESAVSKQNEL
jgi:hypothetical protein